MDLAPVTNIQPVSNRYLQKEESLQTTDKNTEQRTGPKKEESSQVNPEAIANAVEDANKVLNMLNTRLQFSVHEKTKQIMVKVINETTGDLIREIPPEKALDAVAKMWELVGILVDEKA